MSARLDRGARESGHKEIDDEIEKMLDAADSNHAAYLASASVADLIANLVDAAKDAARWDGVDDGGATYRVVERDREALDEARWALACAIARELEAARRAMPEDPATCPAKSTGDDF